MTTVGFVGLGHMGGNMAVRLHSAGYEVYGNEREREHARALEEAGLRWSDSPREVAEAADIVLTSLPDDEAVESAASGPHGVLAGMDADKVWVDVSTISPRVSRELARRARERGAALLDAPVSGSVPQVQSGMVTMMLTAAPSRSCASSAPPRTSAGTDRGSPSSSRSTSASRYRCSPTPKVCYWQPASESTRRSRPA
jgi:3-hydroxyisobutyrate dehydrogenase-like beta-hydroxyacid dehydrogenase